MNPWSWASNCVENRVFLTHKKLCEITQMGPLWLYNSQTRAERRSFSAMIALYSSPILTVHPWRAHVQQQQYTVLLLFLKSTVCVDNKKEHYWYILPYKIKKKELNWWKKKTSLKSGVASNHHSRLQKKIPLKNQLVCEELFIVKINKVRRNRSYCM